MERKMKTFYDVTYVCEVCKRHLTEEEVEFVDGTCMCRDCVWDLCKRCECCGRSHMVKNMVKVFTDAFKSEGYVCDDCHCTRYFPRCVDCGGRYRKESTHTVYLQDGWQKIVCTDCADREDRYAVCPACDEWIQFQLNDSQTCPHCGANLAKELLRENIYIFVVKK